MADMNVQFYYDTADPLSLLWEFVSRAYVGGRKIVIRTEDDHQARQVDQMLWTRQQQSFVPHVLRRSPLAGRTPIVIGTSPDDDWPHADLLFNLAQAPLSEKERFRTVVEIVGSTEAEKIPARRRWKQYKQQGISIKSFDSRTRAAL